MFSIIDSEKVFSKRITPYKLRKGEFDVCEPYFREKVKLDEHVSKKQRNKKSSKPHPQDEATKKRHELIRPQLLDSLPDILLKWPNHWKELTVASPSDFSEKDMIDFPSIQDMVDIAHVKFDHKEWQQEQEEGSEVIPPMFELDSDITTELDIFSLFYTIYINTLEKVRLLKLTPTVSYLIPPKSSFLMGSLKNSMDSLGSYIKYIGGADLIIMDPPWPNKSVHRSSHYATQDIYDLFQIPVPIMMNLEKDTLVGIWVTNKPKFRDFILNKLLPAWKLEYVSEWYWLKMTSQAEPIFPIDSEHKKPYEQLILARPKQDNPNRITVPSTHIITSIPSVRHSRKPPLQDVLLKYLCHKENPVCLELFARCLTPGWISWGNECLKFQHINYFEKAESDVEQTQ